MSRTQLNLSLDGLDTKMTLHTTPPHPPPPHKLNVCNTSQAVKDHLLTPCNAATPQCLQHLNPYLIQKGQRGLEISQIIGYLPP